MGEHLVLSGYDQEQEQQLDYSLHQAPQGAVARHEGPRLPGAHELVLAPQGAVAQLAGLRLVGAQ